MLTQTDSSNSEDWAHCLGHQNVGGLPMKQRHFTHMMMTNDDVDDDADKALALDLT